MDTHVARHHRRAHAFDCVNTYNYSRTFLEKTSTGEKKENDNEEGDDNDSDAVSEEEDSRRTVWRQIQRLRNEAAVAMLSLVVLCQKTQLISSRIA